MIARPVGGNLGVRGLEQQLLGSGAPEILHVKVRHTTVACGGEDDTLSIGRPQRIIVDCGIIRELDRSARSVNDRNVSALVRLTNRHGLSVGGKYRISVVGRRTNSD